MDEQKYVECLQCGAQVPPMSDECPACGLTVEDALALLTEPTTKNHIHDGLQQLMESTRC